MLPSISPDDERLQRDHVVIGGKTLDLDKILNKTFFVPEKVKELNETFTHNVPFPHIVFEGMFSSVLLELMYSEFDGLKWNDWTRYDNKNERKHASRPNVRFGHATQLYFDTVHSNAFVDFLQRVTGIPGLVPDPTLASGGMHEIRTGGKFSLHVDFNQHETTKLDTRLVFITYLNKDWLASYGGTLELWSIDEKKCMAEIVPTFGRSALFAHSSKSLHGHPNPVRAPDGRSRRSAAAYFYTNGRSDGESRLYHSTLYPNPITLTQREKIGAAVKYVMPPVMVDALRKVRAFLHR